MPGDVFVAKSKIHGVGVFASRSFTKGETVLRWDLKEKISSEKMSKLPMKERKHMILVDGAYYILKSPEGLLNHSCNPNTQNSGCCDVAVKNIKKGEEITTNYMKGESPGQGFECRCGSKKCMKIIERS
jgi:SET domain-containing protein